VSSRRLVTRLALLALLVAACNDYGPAPLTKGTRLPLDTAAGPAGACPGTVRLDIVLERDGEALAFVDGTEGRAVELLWPVGFAAWLVGGAAIVYASDGAIVLREGGGAASIGGVPAPDGGPFRVCSVGVRSYD